MSQALVKDIDPKRMPIGAAQVLSCLEHAGYEAWLVGGWVRDSLRGTTPHDVDICTNALWQEAKQALEAYGITVHETGVAHGTITAVCDSEPIEVTTYRTEGSYTDNRHPDTVSFVKDIREDLARRDFTINAMAWHPTRGLLDLYGGVDDLAHKQIRAVGNSDERFNEDALRILRAIRFACRFGFSIEQETQRALVANTSKLDAVAQERIGTELDGIVDSGRLAWAMRSQAVTLCQVIPALTPLIHFEQSSQYHCFDIYEHTARVCEGVELYTGGCASKRLRWAALMHDVGKPATFFTDDNGQGHFYGHPHEGEQITRAYLGNLALPHEFIADVCALVRLHDRPMSAEIPSELSLLKDLDGMLKNQSRADTLGIMHEMLDLRRADALAKAPAYRSYATELDEHETLLRKLEKSNACWRLDGLAISGKDLVEAGISPGPQIGEFLNKALEAVIHQEASNTKKDLLAYLNL